MSGRDLGAEVAFLTGALKAPTLREAVPRLAERAREQSWSHEEFLIACLQREVSARESHGGEGRIRAVCMKPTDGLTRGTPVRHTGSGITVPVGERVLGHVWNVWGDPLDADPAEFADMERWEIHRPAPDFAALEPYFA